MRSEREARATFYGMMIAEGVIAMIWAAAALAIYNLQPEDLNIVPAAVLGHITTHFLGTWMGGITVLAVIVLAITSGDTALRSARLILADFFKMDQSKISQRLMISVPVFIATARSAMVVSSVSPERWDTTAVNPALWAILMASKVSDTEPI